MSELHRQIKKVYGDEVMVKSTEPRWNRNFNARRENDVNDEERSKPGCLSLRMKCFLVLINSSSRIAIILV